jgi:geranylgeranyl diphosphate synthase type II
MIHTYSLIHDDLPAMDNDDYRRGRPTNHKVYGEAMAILAGDALLTDAFTVASLAEVPDLSSLRDAIGVLSECAGSRGMVGGQVLDLEAAEKEVDGKTLGLIHMLKTCALIKASVLIGCYAAGAGKELCDLSEKYAENFGLAFQIIDDILDFDGNYDTCELNSYVKVHGLEKAREDASEYIKSAKNILSEFKEKGFVTSNFEELLEFLIKRMN